MKLEPKHLFPYGPYGLKVIVENKGYIMKSCFLTGDGSLAITTTKKVWINEFPQRHITEFKLILHPLSDLTKEIEHNGEKFEETEFFRMYFAGLPDKEIHLDGVTFKLERWQKLFEWHFDCFNLIENNLAIDINKIK